MYGKAVNRTACNQTKPREAIGIILPSLMADVDFTADGNGFIKPWVASHRIKQMRPHSVSVGTQLVKIGPQ